MIKHIQTKLHSSDVTGNCFATAIACLLECRIDQVPNVEELFKISSVPWYWVMDEWLQHKGFSYESNPKEFYDHFDDYYLVSGKSPRGNFNHIVIYKNGKMIHDPHPSGDGILTEEVFEHIKKNHGEKQE